MKRPNILFITSDQQHYNTLGVTNPKIKTPALDRMCNEGMRFDRAYCPNPTCSPTRASLVTGQYPSQHGCYSLGTKLMEDAPSVAEEFTRRGYQTTLIGKVHLHPLHCAEGYTSLERQPTMRDLDFWRCFHGPWYGFSHVETARMHSDESHVGQHYAIWLEEQGLKNWKDYFRPLPGEDKDDDKLYFLSDQRSWKLPAELHHTHWVGERTIAAIEKAQQDEEPFFLWASFFDPHPPYVVSEPWASMYDPVDMEPGTFREGEFDDMPAHFKKTQEADPDWSEYREPGGNALHGCHSHRYDQEKLKHDMACYYGMQSFIDDEIGRILDTLDRLGLAEDTLIVYSTDHGHFIGQHGLMAKGPFHYEDMIRIPFIVRQPGTVPAGKVSNAIQSLVDVPGTFMRWAGFDMPGYMQSVDQTAVWRGESELARDHALVENRHNPTTMHLTTYVDERYKITVYRAQDDGEIFDLQDDPEERRNLWNSPDHQGLKTELLHRFVQAIQKSEPTPMPRISGA